MRVHLINPSDTAFGTAVITPRWLFVLAAATPEEQAAATSAWLATFAFGIVLLFADVAVADWLLPNFDISGFFAYVGTVALVIAASFAVYSPLYVARRVRRMA